MYLMVFIGLTLLSAIVSSRLSSKFKEYSKIKLQGNMTGKDIAEIMLRHHDVLDVSVHCTEGHLTDHYDPTRKVINLSRDVYYGNHIAAAAVAAHETGHAIQHAESYSWLQLRTKLVPVVSFSSRWVMWLLLVGVVLVNTFPNLLLIGIILFATTTLFSVITLPVEINASNRAINWLDSVVASEQLPKAKHALKLAAYTYVIAALSSLATLLHYVMIFLGNRDDD
jgi:Zn-dependent membrane protease YugP